MHLVATNLCVWLRYLITEVLEAVHTTENEVDGPSSGMAFLYLGN